MCQVYAHHAQEVIYSRTVIILPFICFDRYFAYKEYNLPNASYSLRRNSVDKVGSGGIFSVLDDC